MEKLDLDWIRAHPLPVVGEVKDKDARGRVLVVGGAEFVPGALRLTGEAALRAGAGKLQMATVRSAAMALAVLVPEAAMIALPADDEGEIGVEAADLLRERLSRCDTLIFGPGMSVGAQTAQLVAALMQMPVDRHTIILDAAALTCAKDLKPVVAAHHGRVIMTPHHREMSYFTGWDVEEIDRDPMAAAQHVAREFQAIVVLKSARSVLAAPDGKTMMFEGGSIGLATGGSGDVLAGIIGGMAARGADPWTAAGWGVFVHGAAGLQLSKEVGEIGFLARELLSAIPKITSDLLKHKTDPGASAQST